MSPETLNFFLETKRDEVAAEVVRRLHASELEHYRQIPTEDLRPRILALYDAYRASVLAGDHLALHDFLTAVAHKRLQQGYGLEELLLLVNALFDVTWEEAARAFEGRLGEAFDDLRRLAQGFIWAKGDVAVAYAQTTAEEREALRRLNTAFNAYLRLKHENEGGGTA